MITKDILNKYTEPHRFYHNLGHIGYMIQAIDRTKEYLDFELTTRDREILMEAIIYHDVIYNIRNEDDISNEQKSADYYAEHAPIFEQQVYDMILASEHHFTENEYDELTSYFLDLDLSNLFLENWNSVYLTDVAIRKEYMSKIDSSIVMDGRRKFILNTLSPNIRIRSLKNELFEKKLSENIQCLKNMYGGDN